MKPDLIYPTVADKYAGGECPVAEWVRRQILSSPAPKPEYPIPSKLALTGLAQKLYGVVISPNLLKSEIMDQIEAAPGYDPIRLAALLRIGVSKWAYIEAGLPEDDWPKQQRKCHAVNRRPLPGANRKLWRNYYDLEDYLTWRATRSGGS